MVQNNQDVKPKPKSKVQVLFRNGSVITLEVNELKIIRDGERITKLSWVDVNPKIMFISLPDILTILELEN